MDKLISRQVNKNVNQNSTGQQYSIPPPHAHSLINKRETSPMVINTEIKVSEALSTHSSTPLQSQHLHSTSSQQQQHHSSQPPSSQQQSTQQQQTSIHNGGSPISTYSSEGLPLNGNKMVSPESGNLVVSGEHEIKFTKTEGCTPSTCICVFIAILLISIGASSGIFYGLRSYEDALLKDQVFKGQFTVTRGDSYSPEFEKRSSDEFKETSSKYKTRLDKLFTESGLAKAFRRSEILALEKTPKVRSDDLIVHYNLVFSPLLRPRLSPADVYTILIEEVRADRKKAFKNITIDPNSIDVLERKSDGGRRGLFYTSSPSFPASAQFLENPSPWEAKPGFPGLLEGLTTEPTPPPRRCVPIELPFCSNLLDYNYTSYPNIGGHWNLTSLESDLIPYRQIVDAECYPLAREFICQIVQPQCWEDEIIPPCREYCEDFVTSCKDWLVKSIVDKLKCKQFPSSDEGNNNSGTTTSSFLTTTSSYNGSQVMYTNRDMNSHEKLASRLIGRGDEKRLQYKCRVKPGVNSQRATESIRVVQATSYN